MINNIKIEKYKQVLLTLIIIIIIHNIKLHLRFLKYKEVPLMKISIDKKIIKKVLLKITTNKYKKIKFKKMYNLSTNISAQYMIKATGKELVNYQQMMMIILIYKTL